MNDIQTLDTIARGHDLDALQLEIDPDQLPDDLVVVHNKHPARRAWHNSRVGPDRPPRPGFPHFHPVRATHTPPRTRRNPFMNTPSELVVFYPSPRATPHDRHAPVAQGIEQRPPEPCAQVRILPGAPCTRCPKTPPPALSLRTGSWRMCRQMQPGAAVCRRLWTRRGRDLEGFPQVAQRIEVEQPRRSLSSSRQWMTSRVGRLTTAADGQMIGRGGGSRGRDHACSCAHRRRRNAGWNPGWGIAQPARHPGAEPARRS